MQCLPYEPIKETLVYQPHLLCLKHETKNNKVRRRDISGSPITAIIGDEGLEMRLHYELLEAMRVVVPRLWHYSVEMLYKQYRRCVSNILYERHLLTHCGDAFHQHLISGHYKRRG